MSQPHNQLRPELSSELCGQVRSLLESACYLDSSRS